MNALSITARAFALPARLTFTFVLLAYPAYLGFTGASPWSILALGAVFVMADVFGKWRLYDLKSPAALGKFFAKGYPVQLIVTGVIYLIARGLGSMMGRALADNGVINWPSMGLYALVIAATGAALIWLERGKPTAADLITDEIMATMDRKMDETHGDRPTWDVSAPTERVTLENFYHEHHFSNYDNLYENQGKDKTLKDIAFLSEEDVAREEARLGITLPETLRALYLKQNGGYVGDDTWSGDADKPQDKDLNPFTGYGDLLPLTFVRSLHACVEDYASPEDDPEHFPNGSARMIVLAQWYRHTLFLDYRTEGAPRVGFYDFDAAPVLTDGSWEADCQWWADFDAFFATLYLQERELFKDR